MGPEFHNSTIMVRGLAQHIQENDIRGDISDYGLVAKDIRLIRKKESGNVKRDRRIQRGEPPDSARLAWRQVARRTNSRSKDCLSEGYSTESECEAGRSISPLKVAFLQLFGVESLGRIQGEDKTFHI